MVMTSVFVSSSEDVVDTDVKDDVDNDGTRGRGLVADATEVVFSVSWVGCTSIEEVALVR